MASNRIAPLAVAVLLTALTASGCGAAPGPGVPPPPSSSMAAPVTKADAPAGSGPRYVAMGDSAAAAPLVPDQAQPVGCLKSTNDYPSVLARRIGAAAFDDVTCSGARTQDLVSRSQPTRTGPVPPQLEAVTADTRLVTVTIGGNDVDLPTIATKCRRTTLDVPPCAPDLTAGGVDTISQAIDDDADAWSNLVDAIRERAPSARVVLVGYGTYVRPEGCSPTNPSTRSTPPTSSPRSTSWTGGWPGWRPTAASSSSTPGR